MNLTVKLPNGNQVTGRTEEWLAAVLSVLSEDQKRTVFQAVQQKMVAYKTPGHHVLQAEPMQLGVDVR